MRALDEQSREIRVPVHVAQNMKKSQKVRKDLQQELGREAERSRDCGKAGNKTEEVKAHAYISKDSSFAGNAGGEKKEIRAIWTWWKIRQSIRLRRQWIFLVQKEEVQELFAFPLSEREQKVLKMRFGLEDGKIHTLEEVGQELCVTRERMHDRLKRTPWKSCANSGQE